MGYDELPFAKNMALHLTLGRQKFGYFSAMNYFRFIHVNSTVCKKCHRFSFDVPNMFRILLELCVFSQKLANILL